MGLSSAMTTALTGLSAAETQIDVAGNNLANSQTVGFKASDVVFANQFLRTLSQGSTPTDNNGGTNPRQIGLGVQVAEITPDFTQGTIEISSSPSDLAIQGDGFFIVEGAQGQPLYTRNGIFKTNSENELVSATGNRLLGYGVDEFYTLQETQLVPLTIPLGSAASAQATENVYLNGNLTPTGDVATAAEVIESDVLGDAVVPRPDVNGGPNPTNLDVASRPDASGAGTSGSSSGVGSGFVDGDQYEYVFTLLDTAGNETLQSQSAVPVTVNGNSDSITLSNLPSSTDFGDVNVYRRKVGAVSPDPEENYHLVGTTSAGAGSFVDNVTNPAGLGPALDETALDGIYSYLVTFSGAGVEESRPSELLGPTTLVNGRFHLTDLPSIPSGPDVPNYDTINIYRNLSSNADQYFLTGSVQPGAGEVDYVDGRSDAEISDPTSPGYQELDMEGPTINHATRLVDVVRRNGLEYENLFQEGELTYTGRKGGNILTEKSLTIDDSTTVADYLQFLEQASGIQVSNPGDTDPIPPSVNDIPGESGVLTAGGTIASDGRLRLVSNNGTGNAVNIPSSAFQLTLDDGTTASPNLGFSSAQEAVGQSAASDFIVYDSLGIPLNVRLTTVLESRDGQTTTYRWFADSGNNDPSGPNHEIAVGTGLISFDGEGNLIQANNPVVNIGRNDIPSANPLDFQFDFSQVSGFASENSEIAASRQDGSAVGTLTSYAVGEGGKITGVFSNGISRTLGQVRLANFANPTGLQQVGENMFNVGFNSGLPVEGNPGDLGLGTIVSGALELSNTDTGENLIDLLLASTQYRANSRVISTAQQLLDDLLNMRR
jgi:flagellar hook protein FlgE